MLKVVTLNTLVDLTDWDLRAQVIVDEIKRLDPDIVAFQEVVLPLNTTQWVADRLDGFKAFVTPDAGMMGENEALAILTRLEVLNLNVLDLVYQNRKAQVLTVLNENDAFLFVNTHLFWHTDPAPERLEQVRIIVDRLALYPNKTPRIICGDLNSLPGSPTIDLIKQNYQSAYALIHGHEPGSTFPTPLNRDRLRKDPTNPYNQFMHPEPERETIDYIFISPNLKVTNCVLVFYMPHPHNPDIFASDHYGLYAEIVFKHN
jgi:endonuclease/exonuclease/phosphatase family metal-dependent hydrolase